MPATTGPRRHHFGGSTIVVAGPEVPAVAIVPIVPSERERRCPFPGDRPGDGEMDLADVLARAFATRRVDFARTRW
jgi:hypothetical protein